MQSHVGRGSLFTGMKLLVESLYVSSWLLVVLIALGFLDLQLCGSNGLCHHIVIPPVCLCLHMAFPFLMWMLVFGLGPIPRTSS